MRTRITTKVISRTDRNKEIIEMREWLNSVYSEREISDFCESEREMKDTRHKFIKNYVAPIRDRVVDSYREGITSVNELKVLYKVSEEKILSILYETGLI